MWRKVKKCRKTEYFVLKPVFCVFGIPVFVRACKFPGFQWWVFICGRSTETRVQFSHGARFTLNPAGTCQTTLQRPTLQPVNIYKGFGPSRRPRAGVAVLIAGRPAAALWLLFTFHSEAMVNKISFRVVYCFDFC